MQFVGVIIAKTDVDFIGKNGMKKQSIIVEEVNDQEYKNSLAIDFFGEKCDKLDNLSRWQIVRVFYNPRAKEYNGKWYNGIAWWKVELSSQWGQQSQTQKAEEQAADDNEDLPF